MLELKPSRNTLLRFSDRHQIYHLRTFIYAIMILQLHANFYEDRCSEYNELWKIHYIRHNIMNCDGSNRWSTQGRTDRPKNIRTTFLCLSGKGDQNPAPCPRTSSTSRMVVSRFTPDELNRFSNSWTAWSAVTFSPVSICKQQYLLAVWSHHSPNLL